MDPETKTELTARIEALKELGPEHQGELVAGFMDQLDKEIDRRIDERLANLPKPRRNKRFGEEEIALFIPIFVIAGIFGGGLGIAAAGAALALVFLVSSFR